MLKNRLLQIGAAALGTVLGLGFSVPAGAEKDLKEGAEWPAPYVYTVPYCVAAIHEDPNFINLMDPDRETSVAALAFAYKTKPNVKVGDLITVTPAEKTSTGEPDFQVVKAQDPRCKRFIGE